MNENRSETIKGIPVVIPSYEPDEQLVELCEALVTSGITDICIVDDGSGEEYRSIFDRIETTYANENVRILRHAVNMGKGRALKTAFQDLLERRQGLIGCVTADSDGQHTPKDIYRCMLELAGHPDRFVNQYEFLHLLMPDMYYMGNHATTPGSESIDQYGVFWRFQEGQMGAFPVHDEQHKVIKPEGETEAEDTAA